MPLISASSLPAGSASAECGRTDECDVGDDAFHQQLIARVAGNAGAEQPELLWIVERQRNDLIERESVFVGKRRRHNHGRPGAIARVDLGDGREKIGKPAYADEIRGA